MPRRRVIKGYDGVVRGYSDLVLELKLRAATEFVATFEERMARLQQLRDFAQHPPDSFDPRQFRQALPAVFRLTNLSLGSRPSLLEEDLAAIRQEGGNDTVRRILKFEVPRIRFERSPESEFQTLPRARQIALEQAHIELYIQSCKLFAALYRDLRDRLIWESNARGPADRRTPRQRDQALRDARMHELRLEHPRATWEELFHIATEEDAYMMQLLARRHTALNDADTVRNILAPRRRGR